MVKSVRYIAATLMLLSPLLSAQTFVLDPEFGVNGVATYEWPVSNGYRWDEANAWAVRLDNGKWAVASQLRSGVDQTTALNWFEPNGLVTPASPGAGPYTPLTRTEWNLAGITQSGDGSLAFGTSIALSGNDIDFMLRRSLLDGSSGYNGCNGGFLQQVFFDLAPPTAMADVVGALDQDGINRQVMVGTLAAAGGESRIGVTRIFPQCGLDPTLDGDGRLVIDPNPYPLFPPPRRARANVVIHDPFGRILIGGGVTFGLGNDDGACIIVRLLADGQRDGSFGNAGVAYINSFTDTPGNIRCDVRGLAQQADGRILVNMDWTLTTAQGSVSQRSYIQRLTEQGTYDPSWLDPCCTVGFSNVDVRAGGMIVLEADGIALYVSSELTAQVGVDNARAELIPLRLTDGGYAASFLDNNSLPLGFASTSYHRIVIESPDRFLVVATSGPDFLTHHRTHLIRYRRASTLPNDLIFRNGFEPDHSRQERDGGIMCFKHIIPPPPS